MDTVAAAVGLRVEKLPVHGYQGPDEPGPTAAYQKQRAATVRAALDSGAVVIADGGWEVQSEKGFAPWCWWGIITSANPGDRGLLGACLAADPGQAHGYVDRVVWPDDSWAVYAAAPTLGADQARRQALQNAVARIRAVGPFARTEEHVFGLQAVDAWIAKMDQVPFCGPCFKSAPDRVWSCALNNGQTTTAGATAAAAWLRKQTGAVAEQARPRLEAAAGHYDRIVALLRPAVTGQGGESYQQFINDLSKQKAHVENVLKPVKAELAAAADEMAAALAAEDADPPDDARPKEGRRVMLDSLKARPRWVTHMGCIGGCLDYLGMKVTDGWLYGATGYAFALNIHKQLCPSAPYTWEGDDQVRLGRNVGYTQETVLNKSKDDFAQKQRLAWDMVRKALDEGSPCLAYDLEFGEWYVVHGYDQSGHYYRAIPSLETDGPLAWDKLGTTGIVGVVAVTAGGRDTERDLLGRPGGYRCILDSRAAGEPCPVCGTAIEKMSYLGGACYFCPACQS